MRVLFINSREKQCGVYQMGRRIAAALLACSANHYLYAEVNGMVYDEIESLISSSDAEVVIYNYHPATLPLAVNFPRKFPNLGHGAIIHEVTRADMEAGRWTGEFGGIMVADPSLPIRLPGQNNYYKCVRPLPYRPPLQMERPGIRDSVCYIGSYGFATGGKGFERVMEQGFAEFGCNCSFRFNIPIARYGDPLGRQAEEIANKLNNLGNKMGVVVHVSHRFMADVQLIRWLEFHDLNAFLYDQQPNRGVASATDFAIAAKRPLIVSDSDMFRHLKDYVPTYPQKTFRRAIEEGPDAARSLYESWTWNYLAASFDEMTSRLVQTKDTP